MQREAAAALEAGGAQSSSRRPAPELRRTRGLPVPPMLRQRSCYLLLLLVLPLLLLPLACRRLARERAEDFWQDCCQRGPQLPAGAEGLQAGDLRSLYTCLINCTVDGNIVYRSKDTERMLYVGGDVSPFSGSVCLAFVGAQACRAVQTAVTCRSVELPVQNPQSEQARGRDF